VIKELKSRFQYFKETGDDSKIPADLQRTIYGVVRRFFIHFWCGHVMGWLQAVKYGGREEYNKIVEIHDKPKAPSEKISAMWVMPIA